MGKFKWKKLVNITLGVLYCGALLYSIPDKDNIAKAAPSEVSTIKPNFITLPITVRDYKPDGFFFEANVSFLHKIWDHGLFNADEKLGENGKPTFNDDVEGLNRIAQEAYNQRYNVGTLWRVRDSNQLGTLEDAKQWYQHAKDRKHNEIEHEIYTAYRHVYYYIHKFFSDLQGDSINNSYNWKIPKELTLNRNGDYYSFDSGYAEYFPINNEGFGNYQNGKNFHFSMEAEANFYVTGDDNLEFKFSGDDDVWVYIDDELVMDLGGLHVELTGGFKIINGTLYTNIRGKEKTIELSKGSHTFKIFYMERHTLNSNLKINTNIVFDTGLTLEKEPYTKVDNEINNLDSSDYLLVGDRVYYKFKLQNMNNTDFRNIEIEDSKLGVKINKTGVYKYVNNSWQASNANVTILKNGRVSDLSALSSLEPGSNLEVICEDLLSELVTQDDFNNTTIDNTVNARAEYQYLNTSTIQTTEKVAESSVPVEDINYDVDIVKSISEIYNNGNPISDIDNHLLVPGDSVVFKIDLTNNSKLARAGSNIAIKDLELYDTLYINNDKVLDSWIYENNGTNIDNLDIDLDASETKSIYVRWDITLEQLNKFNSELDKDVTNVATIKKLNPNYPNNSTEEYLVDKSSEVGLKIQPLELILTKAVIGDYDNTKFTVIVEGEDGKSFTLIMEPHKEYRLNNLPYQSYTISEVVPLDYRLTDITVKGISQNIDVNKITLDATSSPSYDIILVNEINKSVNFHNSETIENKLTFKGRFQ